MSFPLRHMKSGNITLIIETEEVIAKSIYKIGFISDCYADTTTPLQGTIDCLTALHFIKVHNSIITSYRKQPVIYNITFAQHNITVKCTSTLEKVI